VLGCERWSDKSMGNMGVPTADLYLQQVNVKASNVLQSEVYVCYCFVQKNISVKFGWHCFFATSFSISGLSLVDFNQLYTQQPRTLWQVRQVAYGPQVAYHSFILPVSVGSNYIMRGPFEKFVDWRQCAAVMQREAVTVIPSCSGGGNVVVASLEFELRSFQKNHF
jgi:hypothetical protein